MDIRDEIEQIKGEIKILETGYAAIFRGDIVDIREEKVDNPDCFIIPNAESWIADRRLEIERLEYKLEVLRLAEDIIKIFPKLFMGEEANKEFEKILKRASKIRNNTIGD